ncbi:MAG: glycosyltransferase family 2 protein [Dehalococcoidales bacterium]
MPVKKPENCPPITVLICALNEEENLQYVLPKIPDWVDEVILVDGHSTDNTIETAKKLNPAIKIVKQSKTGKGNAIKCGFNDAKCEIVITIDADGSTDPCDLPQYIEPLLNGFDLVKGTRFLNTSPIMPLHHKFGNWVLTKTTNLLFGTSYTDVCSGYNAIRKTSFLNLNLCYDGFEMEQEMLIKAKKRGLRVAEVRQIDNGRIANVSKVSAFRQGFFDFWVIIKERF